MLVVDVILQLPYPRRPRVSGARPEGGPRVAAMNGALREELGVTRETPDILPPPPWGTTHPPPHTHTPLNQPQDG